MIDNPKLMERLRTKLQAALPISARVMPEVAAALQAENPISDSTGMLDHLGQLCW